MIDKKYPGIGATKEVYFVEVKFRESGEYKAKDRPKDYPYTNAYIVLVSKKHIKCITVQEWLEGQGKLLIKWDLNQTRTLRLFRKVQLHIAFYLNKPFLMCL